MRDAEQPGAQQRRLPQLLQRRHGAHERILNDVLALDGRAHQPSAIAVQLGAQLVCLGKEGRSGFAPQWLRPLAHSASLSMMATPLSPESPKAKPCSCAGSSSTATT